MKSTRSKSQIKQTALSKRDDLRRKQDSAEKIAKEAEGLARKVAKIELTIVEDSAELIKEQKAEIADRSTDIIDSRLDDQVESAQMVQEDISENHEARDETTRQLRKSESISDLSDKGKTVSTDKISGELGSTELLLHQEVEESKRADDASNRSLQSAQRIKASIARGLKS